MKFQYMNGLSHTHTNDLLNALLEYIKFYLYIYTHCIFTYIPIHQTYSQLLLTVCFFTETGLE